MYFYCITIQACKKTCFQKALVAECSCFDFTVPSDLDAEAFDDLQVEVEEGLYNCIDDGHPELGTSTYHAMYIILNLRMLDAEKGGGGEGTRV